MGSSSRREDPPGEALSRAVSASSLTITAPRTQEYAADDSVDLVTLWNGIKEQRGLVLGIALSFMAAVMAHTMMARMEFKSTGRLFLGEVDAKNRPGSELDVLGNDSGDIASELEILKSRSIVLEAIEASGLNAAIQPVGWSAPRYWQWLFSRRDPALLRGASHEVTVTEASLPATARESQAFGVAFVTARDYEVRVLDELVGKGTLGVPLITPLGSFTLAAGRTGTPTPGKSYALSVSPLPDAVDGAIANLTFTVPKSGTNELVKVVTLEFTHDSPERAAQFLTQLMGAYLRERQSWKTADATAAESFVSDQLKGMRDTLDATQKRLADYRSSTNLVVLDNEAKAMIEQMGRYEEQRVAARLQVSALADIQRMLKNPNPPVEAYLLGEASDTVLEGLGRSLAASRRELTDLEGRFHDAAPDVRNQKAQIAAQLDTIRNYVASRYARAQEHLSALSGIIAQFEGKLKTVPGAELGLAQLSRESDVYNKLYSYLLERQQQAAIQKASTVSKNRILDAPEPARRESSPQLAFRLASGLFGLLFGVFFVIIRRLFASTLQTDADVRAMAAGSPVLVSIPRCAPERERRRLTKPAPFFGRMAADTRSPFAEAFRTLRTSLYHSDSGETGQVLLVTSPTPGDGKTTSTLSLAAMLAADSKWVLVIDADVRKPSHHQLLEGHDREEGLRDVLSGDCDWRDVVRPVPGPFGELFSMSAGKAGADELLSSDRMERFLVEARSRYDFILIDSPSFPLVADALVLAPLADAVLSVVRLDHTPRALAAEHVRRMSTAAHTLGVVVNGVTPGDRYGYGTMYPPSGRRSAFWLLKRRRSA